MLRRLRIKYAAKCGRVEHKCGRLIFFPILATIVYGYIIKNNIVIGLGCFTISFWILYIGSHTFEKRLYGHFGPRG